MDPALQFFKDRIWPIARALILFFLVLGLLDLVYYKVVFNFLIWQVMGIEISPFLEYLIYLPTVMLLSLSMVILIWKRLERRPFSDMMAAPMELWKSPFALGLIAGTVEVTVIFLIVWALGGVDVQWGFEAVGPRKIIAAFVLFVTFGIITGLREEFWLRGYLFQNFKRGGGMVFAIVATSVLFGLAHIFNYGVSFLGILNIILIGIMFALGMLLTRSIAFPVAWHAVRNVIPMFIFGTTISGFTIPDMDLQGTTLLIAKPSGPGIISGGAFGMEASFIQTIVVGAIIIVMISRLQKGKRKEL